MQVKQFHPGWRITGRLNSKPRCKRKDFKYKSRIISQQIEQVQEQRYDKIEEEINNNNNN